MGKGADRCRRDAARGLVRIYSDALDAAGEKSCELMKQFLPRERLAHVAREETPQDLLIIDHAGSRDRDHRQKFGAGEFTHFRERGIAIHFRHADIHQQHPITLYLVVWGWLFVLSAFSYLVDYFHIEGYLRWSLILTFMMLKAGLIVAVFMHMAWERLALAYAILLPPSSSA